MNARVFLAATALVVSALTLTPATTAAESAENRTWTSKDGTATIDARFFKTDATSVTLILPNGRSQVVQRTYLSDADLAWIDEKSAVQAAAESPAGAPPTAPIPAALAGEIMDQRGADVSLVGPNGKAPEYYLFYYSASWCGPCVAFTPELTRFYRRAKSANDAFEIVLVPSDKDLESEKAYMKDHDMPWMGLKWNARGYDRAIPGNPTGGIPALVLTDANGKILLTNKDINRSDFLDEARNLLSTANKTAAR